MEQMEPMISKATEETINLITQAENLLKISRIPRIYMRKISFQTTMIVCLHFLLIIFANVKVRIADQN